MIEAVFQRYLVEVQSDWASIPTSVGSISELARSYNCFLLQLATFATLKCHLNWRSLQIGFYGTIKF